MEQGNVLPEELAIAFLSELDGLIQSDIMLLAPEEIVVYDSAEQELLLKPPHDGIYVQYLVAMIRQIQQEFEGYQNAQAVVNEKLATFRRWFISRYRPADRRGLSYTGTSAGIGGFAYLSAYGIAVNLGFRGTEAEWLESLKGETGAAGAPAVMRYDAGAKMVQWSNDGVSWTDLLDLAELTEPVVAALLAEARDYADTAGKAAEEAKQASGRAASEAAAAETAAAAAQKAAEEAKQAAEESGGGVKASVSVVDGIQVVTAAAGAVTVKVVDGIQTIA